MEHWVLLVVGAAIWFVGWPIGLAVAHSKARAQVHTLATRIAALEARLSERDDGATEAPPTVDALPRDESGERAMEIPPPDLALAEHRP